MDSMIGSEIASDRLPHQVLYAKKTNLSDPRVGTFHKILVVHIDVWMSVLLQSMQHAGSLPMALPGIAVPSDTVASRFSVETLYADTAADAWVPFGVHKPHAYLPVTKLERLYACCPPALELARLMNESKVDGGLWPSDEAGSSDAGFKVRKAWRISQALS